MSISLPNSIYARLGCSTSSVRLRYRTLKSEVLLLEVLGRGVLNLELGHGIRQSGLNLLLLAALELAGRERVGDHLLDTRDVGLELLEEKLVYRYIIER